MCAVSFFVSHRQALSFASQLQRQPEHIRSNQLWPGLDQRFKNKTQTTTTTRQQEEETKIIQINYHSTINGHTWRHDACSTVTHVRMLVVCLLCWTESDSVLIQKIKATHPRAAKKFSLILAWMHIALETCLHLVYLFAVLTASSNFLLTVAWRVQPMSRNKLQTK